MVKPPCKLYYFWMVYFKFRGGMYLPVLVLSGSSELSKERKAREIAKEFGGNYIKIHPEDENKLEVLKSSVSTIGMFGSKTVVDILDYDQWKAKEKKELEGIIKSVPNDVYLIIRAKKGIKGAAEEKFDLPKPWEREKWIKFLKGKFEEKGIKSSDEVIEMFFDLVGDDEFRIENEIGKLSLYVQGNEVTAEDVQEVVFKSTVPGLDELCFSISERNPETAHLLLKEISKSAESYMISATIARHFIDLFRIKLHVREKDKYNWPDVSRYSKELSIAVPKMARFLGFKFKGWKNVPFNHVKEYSMEELSTIIKKLYVMDRNVKMSEIPLIAIHDFIDFVTKKEEV